MRKIMDTLSFNSTYVKNNQLKEKEKTTYSRKEDFTIEVVVVENVPTGYTITAQNIIFVQFCKFLFNFQSSKANNNRLLSI
jgi:hypothetical protein